MIPDTNGWSRSEKYVIEELKRLSDEVKATRDTVTNLRIEVAQKGAIWGAISGTVVGLVAWALR